MGFFRDVFDILTMALFLLAIIASYDYRDQYLHFVVDALGL